MEAWTYVVGAIEFNTLSKNEDFSKYYIDEILKYIKLNKSIGLYINQKKDSNNWILTLCGNLKNEFLIDLEKQLKEFLRYLYKYLAINNIAISIYNEESSLVNIDSKFLDFDIDIKDMDEKANYDYDKVRTKNQEKYLNRYTQKQWETIRDMCMALSNTDFNDLVKTVNKYKEE